MTWRAIKFFLFLTALTASMCLSSCGAPSPAPIASACPPPTYWSKDRQAALVDELTTLPYGSPVRRLHDDWSQMRTELRKRQQPPTPKPFVL
jgi:hypothetical protein